MHLSNVKERLQLFFFLFLWATTAHAHTLHITDDTFNNPNQTNRKLDITSPQPLVIIFLSSRARHGYFKKEEAKPTPSVPLVRGKKS
jgi:hypothetical protein